MQIRSVDAVQYDRRLTYDFDMIQNRWDQSLSPGNEQRLLLGLGRGVMWTAPATTWASKKSRGGRDDRRDA